MELPDGKTLRAGDHVSRNSQEEADIIFLRNQEASPLLQLPGEIRNKIYQYALGGHHIYLDEHQPSFKRLVIRRAEGKRISKDGLFALGYTCRQTHSESAILLFSLNEFIGYFWSTFEIQRCELFSPSQRNAIRNISVTICCFRHFKGSETIIVDKFGGLVRITLVATAVDVADTLEPGSECQPYTTDGRFHPISTSSATEPPVSSIDVDVDMSEAWEYAWETEHQDDDEDGQEQIEDEDGEGRKLVRCCSMARPQVPPFLKVLPTTQRFVTIHDYITQAHA
ncbi:hypothetical protein AA0113_g6119 [Alternaria arborescens]|uniref:DUF7730 domain-containing protein n=1 Tax=Alternaria arborescens TaxID=156630 RepID=A0A4Q4S244_9PLEO|nr:hypothetical protein AA0113_g6119 [Alternaria arborescens]